jgi:Tfp pilus assembly protein PilF
MQARRYREAEKNFNKSFQIDPKNLDNLIQLGNSLIEQRRYAEARENIKKQKPLIRTILK